MLCPRSGVLGEGLRLGNSKMFLVLLLLLREIPFEIYWLRCGLLLLSTVVTSLHVVTSEKITLLWLVSAFPVRT